MPRPRLADPTVGCGRGMRNPAEGKLRNPLVNGEKGRRLVGNRKNLLKGTGMKEPRSPL